MRRRDVAGKDEDMPEDKKAKWVEKGAGWRKEGSEGIAITVKEAIPAGTRLFLFPNRQRTQAIAQAKADGKDTTAMERWPTHRLVLPPTDGSKA